MAISRLIPPLACLAILTSTISPSNAQNATNILRFIDPLIGTINGGHVIYEGKPPAGQPGNTWVAVEINAKNGRITAPDQIVQSAGAANVR